jgi:hypothetical protein
MNLHSICTPKVCRPKRFHYIFNSRTLGHRITLEHKKAKTPDPSYVLPLPPTRICSKPEKGTHLHRASDYNRKLRATKNLINQQLPI